MSFTPKQWHDRPNTTTPVNAAALIDLETRVTNYTDTQVASSGGSGVSTASWDTISNLFGQTGGTKFHVAIPVPNDPTGFEYKDAYSDTYWDFNYWKGEIDYAVSAVHVNGIKIAGDGLWPDISKIGRIMQIADYARDRGLSIHLETTAIENGGTQAQHLAATTTLAEAFKAARVAGKPHKLIGVDLNNEIANGFGGWSIAKPNSAAIAYMTATATAWRNGYGADIPVSWSIFGQNIEQLQDTASDGWIATMKSICNTVGLPFYIDWHPYAVPAHPPFTYAQYKSIADLWPTIPIFFGEASVYAGLENQEWEAVYGYIADIIAANPSYLGVAVYRLDVLEPFRDTVSGGVRQTELLRSVQLIPRIDGGNYGASFRGIPGDNLTNALAPLTASTVPRLKQEDASLYPGKIPGWRIVGDIEDVTGGDTVRVQVKDKDNNIYGSGTRLADITVICDGPAGTTSIQDLSSHSRVFTPVGTTPTVTTGGGGKIGEAFVFGGSGHLSTPQITFNSKWWFGCWIKPTNASGMIAGQWKNGASSGATGEAIVGLFYDNTNQSIYVWSILGTGAGAFASTNTSSNTVPIGVWSYVVVGIEAGGYLLTGAATGSATNVHLEDPGFPNGALHPGDGVTPFTIGDASNGGSGFIGAIDSPIFYNAALSSTDFAVPTTTLQGISASNSLLEFALPLDALSSSGGTGTGHFAGPVLPYPATLNTARVWAQNQTASRGKLSNLGIETVYR
jgi:hypothetical protein